MPGQLLASGSMYRTAGIVALLIGLVLAFLWGFLPFTQQLSYRVSFDDGQPVWTRTVVECPNPWAVLIEGERAQAGELAVVGDECERPARSLMTGAVLALIAGVILGIYGISRGPRPKAERIEPLSDVIARRSAEQPIDSSGK